jgi:hypothetical protein
MPNASLVRLPSTKYPMVNSRLTTSIAKTLKLSLQIKEGQFVQAFATTQPAPSQKKHLAPRFTVLGRSDQTNADKPSSCCFYIAVWFDNESA